MIHSKNNHGFTLIEVLISVAIMGFLFTSIYMAQGAAMRGIGLFAQKLRRVLAAQEMLVEMQYQDEAQKSKSLKEARIVVNLQYSEGPAKMGALKDFNDMVMRKVTIEWQEDRAKRTDQILTFAFKPKKKEA